MHSTEPALCYHCGKEAVMPFKCNYCNLTFCSKHRLPESHNCSRLPDRTWHARRKLRQSRASSPKKTYVQDDFQYFGDKNVRRRSRNYKRDFFNILKTIGFILFIFFALLPNMVFYTYLITELGMTMTLYDYFLTIIGVSMIPLSFLGITPLIGITQFLTIISIPILIVQKIRKKTNKWYYLVVLGLCLASWYFIIRLMFVFAFFQQAFSV